MDGDDDLEAGLEALFDDDEGDEATATHLDPDTAATALDTATVAPAATALDPATATTARDPPTRAQGSTAAGGGEGDEEDECGDFEAELLKEVEAALFSGSEDDGEPAVSQLLRGAIERLEPKGDVLDEKSKSTSTPSSSSKSKSKSKHKVPAAGAPPPPPPPPRVEKGDHDFDESRYMKDQNGQLLHKWKVDYATRAGGGRAMCKDTDCLERHDQGGVKFIEKGALRIGRRVLMKGHGDSDEGTVNMMWYHARCMFNVFLRSRKQTRVIASPVDLEGFEHIVAEDQEMLRKFIHSNEDVRSWKGGQVLRPGAGGAKRSLDTPEKTQGTGREPGMGMGIGLLGESKRRKVEESRVTLRKGDRVWTFCRVRPKPTADGLPPAEFAVKSPKPELGMIVDGEKEGHVIVQFEKAEHEKERLELYVTPRKKKIRAWLRYPRIFDGKKQRIPMSWIQFSRPPPKLCSCVRQEWGHGCECSGTSCGRGNTSKIWGVAS